MGWGEEHNRAITVTPSQIKLDAAVRLAEAVRAYIGSCTVANLEAMAQALERYDEAEKLHLSRRHISQAIAISWNPETQSYDYPILPSEEDVHR